MSGRNTDQTKERLIIPTTTLLVKTMSTMFLEIKKFLQSIGRNINEGHRVEVVALKREEKSTRAVLINLSPGGLGEATAVNTQQ